MSTEYTYPNFVTVEKEEQEKKVENECFKNLVKDYVTNMTNFHLLLEKEVRKGIEWLHTFFVAGTTEMFFQTIPFFNFDVLDYAVDFIKNELKKIEGVKIHLETKFTMAEKYNWNGENFECIEMKPSSYYFVLSYSN